MAILDRFRKNKSVDASSEDNKEVKKPATKTSGTSVAPKAKTAKAKVPAKKTVKKEEVQEQTTSTVGQSSSGDSFSHRLLVKPHVSEKAARLADQGVYVFDVSLNAEKVAVKKAVEAMYKTKVAKVRIIRGIGKPVRRGRHQGARSAWKKALVQVKKGQTIDLYEGV